ncbi:MULTISPECIES: hypothetical protein [Xenorhabdus]|nr:MULTISPECIES: hypothetical protein [Xenorhabdus]
MKKGLRFGLPEQHFSQTAVKNDRQLVMYAQIRCIGHHCRRVQSG